MELFGNLMGKKIDLETYKDLIGTAMNTLD